MFPRSSRQRQSSPAREDSGYWFDLPDLTPRKARRKWLRRLLAGLIAAAILLCMHALFRGSL